MRLPFVTRRRHEQLVSTAGMLREYGDTVGRSHQSLLRRNLELIAERDKAQRERDEAREEVSRLRFAIITHRARNHDPLGVDEDLYAHLRERSDV